MPNETPPLRPPAADEIIVARFIPDHLELLSEVDFKTELRTVYGNRFWLTRNEGIASAMSHLIDGYLLNDRKTFPDVVTAHFRTGGAGCFTLVSSNRVPFATADARADKLFQVINRDLKLIGAIARRGQIPL